MTSMSDTQNSSSHGKLIAAVVAAALVVVLALISAFVWPGWALNKNGQAGQAGQTSQQARDLLRCKKFSSLLPGVAGELLDQEHVGIADDVVVRKV